MNEYLREIFLCGIGHCASRHSAIVPQTNWLSALYIVPVSFLKLFP
jgi:hypothetical protein